ncbi:hypothetical protein [Desulforapulum autotrophicum]|uniref:hypothetical protein n=1 Tax=Desulforapulum autotrophicum TaxID=2296 RepID=UPI0002D65A78|nr:hypothetical protein [Desulforapulum autotrophicum]
MIKKISYILENWKMIVHLLFKTRRFGVNNLTWSSHPSVFGTALPLGLGRAFKNYQMMKIRAFSGFIPLNDAIEIFPYHAKKHGYKPISLQGENTQPRQ